ncbi:hypothetical protein CYLTODRAFT_392434 [Cylindrobasidium torrendii FP15055 ss-10]|uniref:Uncharacterized protein n=1 Tax=Cylindrobasidium torrendii FP15055 ss-10 TaxID=1314674 RepID=A0A0D7BHU1_9AGAR|nr:hypothetical protein CYLTODRAFT_392434 [Cylindrobasidium torrendii FP15055 ss-10]
MAPVLPSSLSPHICIIASDDLSQYLRDAGLPPLQAILQSFSPLPQVTTRTTTLSSVPHESFALRFSDLVEIEKGCQEDEEQRATRTLDWIGERLGRRCAKWVDDIGDKEGIKTPWWDEFKRCIEGNHIPARTEAWNHPVAVIMGVSTSAPNPLQAITALHARPLNFPSWLDPHILKCTVIVHPPNSALSDEEVGALFNAVKKQFGLHSYLLPLSASDASQSVPVPALVPRLPALGEEDGPVDVPVNMLKMNEVDIQRTARFAREFVVMSLVPWMERCVVEWNENFAATRRLPSRLFSSTRRLFGGATSPPPMHSSHSSLSMSRSSTLPGTSAITGPPPQPQQRRLAEFATILGDFKLAVNVWDTIRKDGHGGSDILPVLLSPSPSHQLHASNALAAIHPLTGEPRASSQLLAALYGVRWEIGIGYPDFVSDVVEGERWLVWAAGGSEEVPSAILLGQAALLSANKGAHHRAAFWYALAANRLEKSGIKPLTMYFLRKAHGLYQNRPLKELSPSFWDSENKKENSSAAVADIISAIEHPLGRLLYGTGDIEGAVKLFMGLLRDEAGYTPRPDDQEVVLETPHKAYLDDFRTALSHYVQTSEDKTFLQALRLPFGFCVPKHCRTRLAGGSGQGDKAEWEKRENEWNVFWKQQGRTESLIKGGRVAVEETFWVDVSLHNPLDTEVNLSQFTVLVEESNSEGPSTSIDVETIDDVLLGPKESRMAWIRFVSVGVTASRAGTLVITHATFKFLSLLPSTESLATRGRRLHDTPAQRQQATYASDVKIKVEVVEANQRLLAQFVDDGRMLLLQGETKSLSLWLSNAGTNNVDEVWIVSGSVEQVWVDGSDDGAPHHVKTGDDGGATSTVRTANWAGPSAPQRLPLAQALQPEDSTEINILLHSDQIGRHDLQLMVVYREAGSESFHSVQVLRDYDVQPLVSLGASARPARSLDAIWLIDVDVENVGGTDVEFTSVTTTSPSWSCTAAGHSLCVLRSGYVELTVLNGIYRGTLHVAQSTKLFLEATRRENLQELHEVTEFVRGKVSSLLQGKEIDSTRPPALDLCFSRIQPHSESDVVEPHSSSECYFIEKARQVTVLAELKHRYPSIPLDSLPNIFPLYHPQAVDVTLFWRIITPETTERVGHVTVRVDNVGVGHGLLRDIVDTAESAKVVRSMYAETTREKAEVLRCVKESEWNAEGDPVVVRILGQDDIKHAFAEGPCRAKVTFGLRNQSLTHEVAYSLQVARAQDVDTRHSALRYTGRLAFRGRLKPCERVELRPQAWVTRPGSFGAGPWMLEVNVLDKGDANEELVRQRFTQTGDGEDTVLNVLRQ